MMKPVVVLNGPMKIGPMMSGPMSGALGIGEGKSLGWWAFAAKRALLFGETGRNHVLCVGVTLSCCCDKLAKQLVQPLFDVFLYLQKNLMRRLDMCGSDSLGSCNSAMCLKSPAAGDKNKLCSLIESVNQFQLVLVACVATFGHIYLQACQLMQSSQVVLGHEGPASHGALADTVSGLVREFLDMLGSGEAWSMLLLASLLGAAVGRCTSTGCNHW